MLHLHQTMKEPKENAYLNRKDNILSFSLNEHKEFVLSLYPDNVLEICTINKETKVIIDIFDTGLNIASHFGKYEVKEHELINYAKEEIQRFK